MSELPLLDTDTGIIAAALYVYYLEVVELQGSDQLADRAYGLYLKYRDMEETIDE